MDVVVTDLDGTLLDHDSYSFEAALPALRLLEARGVPVVYCTSKTRSETEHWRSATGNTHPFIVENGGAVFIPAGYFGFACAGARPRAGYDVLELGDPYPELVACLRWAAAESRCDARGFHAMSVEEIAEACGLDLSMAALAKDREYDEPFLVPSEGNLPELLAAIESYGKRWTRGGRFYHVLGNNDKARAARMLLGYYRAGHPDVRAVGLGDGLNDAPFLNLVNVPVLVRSPGLDQLQAAVPHGTATRRPGPAGWNEAILELFS